MAASIVVMGVAGSGKSSLGAAVAADAGLPLVEGDDFHPPGNRQKMSAGVPLSDAHRDGLVLTCSALKRAYRDTLRAACPGLRFVFLDISRDDAQRRVAGRGAAHFFSTDLVDSQLATLESPVGEPHVLRVGALAPLADQRREVSTWLQKA